MPASFAGRADFDTPHPKLTVTGSFSTDPRPHVVIIGGGFAGVSAAGAFPNLGVTNETFVPITHWFIVFTVALTLFSALPYVVRSREAWR